MQYYSAGAYSHLCLLWLPKSIPALHFPRGSVLLCPITCSPSHRFLWVHQSSPQCCNEENIKSDPGNLWSREGEMTLPQILFPPSLFIRNFPAGMFLKERLPLIKLSLPQVGLIYSRGQKLLTWQVLTRPLTNKTVNHQHFQQGCHSLGKDAVHHKPPCWNYKAPFPSQGLSKQSSLRKGSTTAPIHRNKKCSREQKLNKRC